jgi:RND family efflux transporter MFP subunit
MFSIRTLSIGLTALLLSSCTGKKPETAESNAGSAKPAITVQAVKVAREEWPAGAELTGTIRARTTTEVASRLMGYIRELRVRTGDTVSAGQLLATIDSRDLDVATRQAEAAETEARSAIAEVEMAARSAQARLDLARVTFQRMQKLANENSISKQEMDEATMRLKLAEADLEAVASKRKQLDAKIAQAQEGVRSTQVSKGYAEIRAPFAGVVIARKAEPGTLAAPGMSLLTIEQSGAYRAEIPVDESKLRDVRVGTAIELQIDALDKSVTAKVTEIVPAIESESRTFLVKADLPAISGLRSGLFARAQVASGKRQVLAIPASLVRMDGQLQSVLVGANGVARERMVRTGSRNGDRLEILSGLQEGDLVIARSGPSTAAVQDGDKVEVRP